MSRKAGVGARQSQTPGSKDCPGSSPATYYDGPDKKHDHQPFLLPPSSVSAVLGRVCQYVGKLALADDPEGEIIRAPAWNRNRFHHASNTTPERAKVIRGYGFLTETSHQPGNKWRPIPVARRGNPCYPFLL